MPKLWNETINGHRQAVRDATLDTAAALAAQHGLAGLTMSRIAEDTGIGRATLYKYFPDVEAILVAWHQRQIERHIGQLLAARDATVDPLARLNAVLKAFALIAHQHHGSDLSTFLHDGHHARHAQRHLTHLVEALIADAATSGQVRKDVAPEELASFCVSALAAAADLPSKAAVDRLVATVLAGLQATV